MLNEDITTREYLLAPEDSFWEWREGGNVIVWKNGVTIVFRGEVAAVLERLAPRGLPPFHAIVLLLAATREGWAADNSEAGILAGMLQNADASHDTPHRVRLLTDVLSGLDRVRAFDADLRTPLPAKCALADLVFEGARWAVNAEQAAFIVDVTRHGFGELLEPSDVTVATRGDGPAVLMRALGILRAGLQGLDADALRLRIETGLTDVPAPAPIDVPPATAAFNLISSLADDDELAGVGRLARRLLTSASLPRRLSAAPEQELGGYSDIANRGSLDRLLASELAHDNLTLAVRVAMNEALYLRRESPPSRPQQHRAVLLDAGIRSWGVPRVFATAAALAFAATLSSHGSISYFRAKRKEHVAVDMLTRTGIVDHLAFLEAELHMAEAIPAFLEGLAGDAAVEPMLLMTEDGLEDAAVQTAVRQAAAPQLFLATVNRQGRFRMYERHPRGTKLLREATLDLKMLLSGGSKLIKPQRSHNFPAIFSAQPFPLRLAHTVRDGRTWYVEPWGALSLTTDRRLMLWTEPRRGAIQITDRLPPGKVWWSSHVDDDDCISIVLGASDKLHLVRVDRHGRHFKCLPLQCDPVRDVSAHQGMLFGIGKRAVYAISMHTGELRQRVQPLHGTTWHRDRFFKTAKSEWYVMSHDGQSTRFDLVKPAVDLQSKQIITTLFDHPGREGPIGVTPQGHLMTTTGSKVDVIPHGLSGGVRVTWISRDGRRLQLTPIYEDRYGRRMSVLVDVDTLAVTRCGAAAYDDRVQRTMTPMPVRHRFSCVGVTTTGCLALKSHRGQVLSFRSRNGLPQFAVEEFGAALRHVRSFEPMASERGYTLSVARWDDGSCCLLDSRGLLHLRAANRAAPEATLVLSEGELSGWSSDARTWGKSYFGGAGTDTQPGSTAALVQAGEFERTVRQFVACIDA